MYCKNCGSQNPENSKFCANCGASFTQQNVAPNAMPISNNMQNNMSNNMTNGVPNNIPNNITNSNYVKRPTLAGILLIISAVTAVLSAIMPFCTWADVPVADNIYSFFGGEGSISSYSLFTYASASGTYTDDISGILGIVLLFAIFAMVMYGVYVTKVILQKKKCLKFLIIGAISMLLVSLIFVLFIGLTSAVTFNLVNMTTTPWIALLLAVANIVFAVLINSERRKGKGDMFKRVEVQQYYNNNQNMYPNNVQGQQYNPQQNQQIYNANQYGNQENTNNYSPAQQYSNFTNQQPNQSNNIINAGLSENPVVNTYNNSQEEKTKN